MPDAPVCSLSLQSSSNSQLCCESVGLAHDSAEATYCEFTVFFFAVLFSWSASQSFVTHSTWPHENPQAHRHKIQWWSSELLHQVKAATTQFRNTKLQIKVLSLEFTQLKKAQKYIFPQLLHSGHNTTDAEIICLCSFLQALFMYEYLFKCFSYLTFKYKT